MTFRMSSKMKVGSNARTVQPQSYPCQAPGCKETSGTIACPWHLNMLPLNVQSALTNALATGETGSYGAAMSEAMKLWAGEKTT